MAQNVQIITAFNVGFAFVIAFGVVYNAARVSLSERRRELASLRVLGFTIREIASILLGELAVLTLVALPVGMVLGSALAQFMELLFQNELYRVRVVLTARDAAWSALTVILAASLSALAVRRQLDRLDLVQVLKTPE
jgi:putative ABC transport system permease protein